MTEVLPTRFAPAERAASCMLLKQAAIFKGNPLVTLLDSVTDLIMILNSNRQIVYANRNLLNLLDMQDAREIIGMRPGELFSCEHACSVPGGCGTSEFCRNCGAVRVIMCALGNDRTEDECRLTQRKGDAICAYDLKVVGSPVFLEGDRYVTFAITDMSHEKRRRALERIFFHDILNTAGGLRNLARMVLEEVPLNLKDETLLLHKFSSELVEEIMAQRVLLAAENAELSVDTQCVNPAEVLRTVRELYASHEVGEGKRILLEHGLCDVELVTDPTLLKRVLANLVKNALEATARGGDVRMGYSVEGREVSFFVWNPAAIPLESRAAIFQRSFSTKGVGRGLGTYSIKLLATNYLKGDVAFVSSEEAGTQFTVRLPITFAQQAAA
ncbi:ATP-binding protein [Desulfovibrio mangrovi]|uniref:PAS domain-containing sensor histidine kinase n=1 Tax=Desulfovibrio mangrovi TaxID=2976983 RepID=UPI002245E8BA|nr:ATP-binding protein [Desulfovibrio mangrovi]UZP69032.1 ATP-binding protein [Desulfovibrio mangrovi]